MGDVADDRAPTSQPGAGESAQPMETQPTPIERASLAAPRRAESDTSPLVCRQEQTAKQLQTKITALTVMYAVCVLLVTVRAVRNVAGGLVQTYHGSVTREKTCYGLCMSHSSQEISIKCTCIRTDMHFICYAASVRSTLGIHVSHTQTGQGGGIVTAQHEPTAHCMQLLENITYTYHNPHFAIITCSCSRVAAAAGRGLGGFWFGAQHHLTHARARARTAPAPNRTAPHRTAPHRIATRCDEPAQIHFCDAIPLPMPVRLTLPVTARSPTGE